MSPRTPALIGLTLLGAATLAAQSITPAQARRIDSVFAAVDGTNRPGCAVGAARDGQPVLLRGYGMSDLQHQLAITPASIFHVASVSKQFTAFAVALLAADGKLSLDDPVRRHVPELPAWADSVTIRQMIHHTSGVRDHWELLGLAGWRYPADLFTQTDVLEILKRQRTLNFAPGSEYLYSNGAYTLLAIIVERVSGKSLREFSRERIFEPLGMRDTHVHDDHSMIVPGRTSAYQRESDGWHISIPVFDTHGATSLFTTVGDLLKWQRNFTTATVGSRALLDEMETSGRLNSGPSIDYGFGISTEVYRGARATGHSGGDAGYRANIVRFPDHGLSVSVLCNFADAAPGRYARSVADVLLEGRLAPAPAAAAVETGTASAEDLARVAGVYRRPGTDVAWRLDLRDGGLVLVNWGVPLTATGPRRFTAFGGVVEFFGPAGAPATSVRVQFGGSTADSMARAVGWQPRDTDLRSMAGRYWSDELRALYEIVPSDSGLVLRRPKQADARMLPGFTDAFLVTGLGTVRVVRSGGRVAGLSITGGRVRNVAFDRIPAGSPVR